MLSYTKQDCPFRHSNCTPYRHTHKHRSTPNNTGTPTNSDLPPTHFSLQIPRRPLRYSHSLHT